MKLWYIILVLWLMSPPVLGQINLKTGYCLSLLKAPTYTSILGAHNVSMNGVYSDPFEPLEILHGFDIGLEHRWESFAVEAGWRTKRNRQEATGDLVQGDFRNHLNWSISSFYAGLVQYLDPIRISVSMDYNYTIAKLKFEEPAILTTLDDHGWGSSFSIGYVFRGSGTISLVIAPYVQLQWGDYDLAPLQNALTEPVSQPKAEDFVNYGITLYFLNGPR